MTEKDSKSKSLKHDAAFKNLLSNIEIAKDFLTIHLPSSFIEEVDLNSLDIEKDSLIEEDLKRRMSDAIFSMKTKDGGDAYAYVILEHQSSVDKLMPLRLWNYMYLWCKKIKNKNPNGKLPLIAPLVFYNGKEKYTAPLNLWEMFENPKKAKELMAGDYQLIDLRSTSDEELKNRSSIGMMEFFMKHVQEREILKLWEDMFNNFEKVIVIDKEKNFIYLSSLLWYTDGREDIAKKEKINKLILDRLSKTDKEGIMRTIADSYKEEWRAEGVIEGVAKGIAQGEARGEARGVTQGVAQGVSKTTIEIACRMLQENVDIRFISSITKLSQKEILKLKKQN